MADAPFLETLKGMTGQEAGIETKMVAQKLKYGIETKIWPAKGGNLFSKRLHLRG